MFPSYPFKILALLSDSTLAIKIREKSWDLDKLFPRLKTEKSELRRLTSSLQSNPGGIPKVSLSIASLAREIRAAFMKLKLINFYDSAILYLYFKSLHHLLDLCKKEESRLAEKIREAISDETSIKEKKESIIRLKNDIEKKIREYGELIKRFDAAKKALIKDYEQLVKELRKRRWDLEKQAQHEFTFIRFTLRSMKNINRKIKIEAIKVKKDIVPQENAIMKRVKQGILEPKDVVLLAKLISEAIGRISKDVYYSSKLISKFEKEIKKLKSIVENLKKTLNKLVNNNKITEETAKKIFEPWDNAINYIEKEIHKDLMQVFRNIFVLYKHVGTRLPAAA